MTSVDAGSLDRLTQDDAYRVARGAEISSTTRVRAQLGRPLDWLVIADHAEMYGLMPRLLSGDPNLLANKIARCWYDETEKGDMKPKFVIAMEVVGWTSNPDPPIDATDMVREAWREYTALADR